MWIDNTESRQLRARAAPQPLRSARHRIGVASVYDERPPENWPPRRQQPSPMSLRGRIPWAIAEMITDRQLEQRRSKQQAAGRRPQTRRRAEKQLERIPSATAKRLPAVSAERQGKGQEGSPKRGNRESKWRFYLPPALGLQPAQAEFPSLPAAQICEHNGGISRFYRANCDLSASTVPDT